MTSENPIRAALETGEQVFGATATTHSPLMLDVYADLGAEFVFLDFEHVGPAGYDADAFEAVRRTADAAGAEPIVRVHSGEPDLIRKVLDAGVHSPLVPRVETAEEVRRSVQASRFYYDGDVGDRGVGSSLSSRWGNRPDDYTEREDDAALVGVMIENRAALSNLEEILSVPGLGFCWLGPTDLSIAFGCPLELDHPDVQGAIDDVRAACADAGVPLGISVGFTDGPEDAVESGYDLVSAGNEVAAARSVVGESLAAMRDAAGGR